MDLEWSDLRVLAALAKGGSVAGAARLLGVDSSTVSRRLTALEEALGAQLVVRSGRELTWTAEGRRALETAERVAEQLEALTREVRAAKTGVSGLVKVSCTPATVLPLSPIVAQGRARHPGLTIELTGQLAMVDLAKGEADVALRAVKPTTTDLVARRGVDIGWFLVASADHPRPLPSTDDEIAAQPLVLYHAALAEVPGPKWIEQRRRSHTPTMRLDNPDAVTYAIASGAGIGVVPCPSFHDRPGLVRVFDEPVASSHLWIVYHQSHRDSARVRAVVDLLVEHFAAEGHRYSGRTP